jgi:hypothetical protein
MRPSVMPFFLRMETHAVVSLIVVMQWGTATLTLQGLITIPLAPSPFFGEAETLDDPT